MHSVKTAKAFLGFERSPFIRVSLTRVRIHRKRATVQEIHPAWRHGCYKGALESQDALESLGGCGVTGEIGVQRSLETQKHMGH